MRDRALVLTRLANYTAADLLLVPIGRTLVSRFVCFLAQATAPPPAMLDSHPLVVS